MANTASSSGTRKTSIGRDRSISEKLLPPITLEQNSFEYDVREDEEQNIKLQQCIELLVAAGYFRARIKGLSPFDKIVGGMTWCITSCNFDVDVDLLFQENSTIGQKIHLTERIVRILPKMKCPHPIEPHQIQGLDFVNIFPVMQWLVKRAMETRAEMGDYIRSFSISQFNKYHTLPQEDVQSVITNNALKSIKAVKTVYQPQRRFRHHDPLSIQGEESRVQTTLLEYGRHYGYNQSKKTTKEDEGTASDIKHTPTVSQNKSEVDTQAEDEKRIVSLMSGLSEMPGRQLKLIANTVGSMVGIHSDEIQQITAQLEKRSASPDSQRVGGAQQHKRMVASLQKQIEHTSQKVTQAQSEHESLQNNYQSAIECLQQVRNEKDLLDAEMAELDAVETSDNLGLLKKLRSLIAMNESLKKQEKAFKAQCKEETARLIDAIRELEGDGSVELTEEEIEREKAIKQRYDGDKEKLQKIRLLLARKNREISTLYRKIDDVPTRAELTQYQKRFVELYNQVATKHTETKQFYTLYNTLLDKKSYLSKEVDLLNSVHDNFTRGMANATSKVQYLQQFESIVDGVSQNKTKAEKTKQGEKVKRDKLNDQYLQLVELQRMYFKTVKDFKQECAKNEVLQSKLHEP